MSLDSYIISWKARIFTALLCFIAILSTTGTQAQDAPNKNIPCETIHFRINQYVVDSSYVDNAEKIALARQSFNEIFSNKNIIVDSITIKAQSSPDGIIQKNLKLAQLRSESIKELLLTMIPPGNENLLHTSAIALTWELMVNDVQKDPNISDKKEVIAILKNKKITNYRKGEELRKLNSRKAYNYIVRYILPKYRDGYFCTVWYSEIAPTNTSPLDNMGQQVVVEKEKTKEIENTGKTEETTETENVYVFDNFTDNDVADTVERNVVNDVDKIVNEEITKTEVWDAPFEIEDEEILALIERANSPLAGGCNTIFAIKTNALFLAATVANIGAEVSIGNKFSIDVPFIYSPYMVARKYRIETMGLQPEFRFWLNDALDGSFFGLHGHVAWYNVAFNDKNRYQDKNGDTPLWGLGVSYGYSKSLSRSWAIEFTIGAGYAHLEYDVFNNYHNGPQHDTGKKNYWGITRAGINVVYKINNNVYRR